MFKGSRTAVNYVMFCVAAVLVCVALVASSAQYSLTSTDSPNEVTIESVESVDGDTVMTGTLNCDVRQGDTAFFQATDAPMSVFMDDRQMFDNSRSVTHEAFGYGWESFVTHQQAQGSTVRVVVQGQNGTDSIERFAESLFIGDGANLLRQIAASHWLQLVAGFLIVALGLAYLALLFLLRHIKSSIAVSYVSCGPMMIAGGICTLIDYSYITLIVPDVWFINRLDFVLQVLSYASLVAYLFSFIHSATTKRRLRPALIALLVGVTLCTVLSLFDVLSLDSMVTILMPLAVVCLGIELVILHVDEHKSSVKLNRLLLQSVDFLAFTVLVELMHFIITGWYPIVVFQLGLVVFGIAQMVILGQDAHEQLLRAERMEKAEAELAQSRISIMLSQVQPHFLYNTLAAIAQLCDKNPKQAKEATIDFADYLRGNMDSLSLKLPVPFSRELEHIHRYLSLEQMRFGEDLTVEYDIEVTDFSVPALCVQPLVENAVRYGVGKKEEGGTVRIATKRTPDGVVITVSDDGLGFNPQQTQSDGRTHIGIDNVALRLETLVNAQLDIAGTPGKGTIATIVIPEEGEQK